MTRAAGNTDNACAIWRGMAPAGTLSVRVFFHRSHMTQRHGHSRLVRKIVLTFTISASLERSTSAKKFQGCCGSRLLRFRSYVVMNRARESACGTRPRETAGVAAWWLPPMHHAESDAWETRAFSCL